MQSWFVLEGQTLKKKKTAAFTQYAICHRCDKFYQLLNHYMVALIWKNIIISTKYSFLFKK